jgi:hypothetical protein
MTLLAQFAVVGGGVANYIENVFSTWLYTGTGATQTITNGIDLVGKGGLTWIKSRSAATDHFLFDTARGALNEVNSNSSAAQVSLAASLTAFNANGFSLGSAAGVNTSSATYASWSFRDQAKFFDVVTYTGTGANRTIAHNLDSVPGCIMVKRTDNTGDWQVYHRSNANTQYMVLNSTAAVVTGATRWNSTTPTNTVFSLGTDATVNASGGTYVAYLFAHDAGGFGPTGTDNVISCGSYVGNGENNGPVVSLGYEPQWLMIKNISNTGGWQIIDNMRGFPAEFTSQYLRANTSDAEATSYYAYANATGFQIGINNFEVNSNGSTYIYIAIRRGPMKVPTTGASVFGLNARTGTGANATVTGSAGVSDAVLIKNRGSTVGDLFASRLTGTGYLETSSLAAEVAAGTTILQANPWDVMDGVKVGTTSTITNASANTYINYLFDRAPGFFDVVCYTGDGTGDRTLTSNLGGPPELCIVKARSTTSDWNVSRGSVSGTFLQTYYTTLRLNTTAAQGTGSIFFSFTGPPYASSFGVPSAFNTSAATYVAYLFATCPGVSKVGSYTGTGTTQTVNCGFTAGSRFVMIKRVDSTSDWYVWDSARGIVAGNDPYLLLNSAAAEVTSTDYIDTAATGFEITSTAPAAINANGGSYLFLAIA